MSYRTPGEVEPDRKRTIWEQLLDAGPLLVLLVAAGGVISIGFVIRSNTLREQATKAIPPPPKPCRDHVIDADDWDTTCPDARQRVEHSYGTTFICRCAP